MTPADWLVQHVNLLPKSGDALDVACGHGRHAFWFAQRGLRVRALDRDAAAIADIQRDAQRAGLPLTAEVFDLEQPGVSLGHQRFDVIVVVHYLHRPLFTALLEALRPDGLLIYETFTLAQAARGKPTNPDFLLGEGELRRLIAPLEVLDYREGTFGDREVASAVARKSQTPVWTGGNSARTLNRRRWLSVPPLLAPSHQACRHRAGAEKNDESPEALVVMTCVFD